jgi:hypothetical protein
LGRQPQSAYRAGDRHNKGDRIKLIGDGLRRTTMAGIQKSSKIIQTVAAGEFPKAPYRLTMILDRSNPGRIAPVAQNNTNPSASP